jgi:uncharacterized membrane protein YraQ (UPF0718 family)
VRDWCTVMLAIVLQALPFLGLGVLISGAVAAFVPAGAFARLLPARPVASVPLAAGAAAALPGCECSSVPVAGRLIERGAPAPAALAFMLAAPAINPVVVVATFVAFPGRPAVAVARFVASLAAAITVGLLWHCFGNRLRPTTHHDEAGSLTARKRWETAYGTAMHDLLHAGGFLTIGAGLAATLQVLIPRSVLDRLPSHGLVALLCLALLAVLLAVCSESDAFIAASLSHFSLAARLAFMVVGPMVDVKLIALQTGTFGRRFAMRFAPLTLVTAAVSAGLVGWVLL